MSRGTLLLALSLTGCTRCSQADSSALDSDTGPGDSQPPGDSHPDSDDSQPPDTSCDETSCEGATCWVHFCAGSYWMGNDHGEGRDDEHPLHQVSLAAFDLAQTETTVEAYAECVAAGACEPHAADPDTLPSGCNWDQQGHESYPMNCATHHMAQAHCGWLGGRLPSEAEWEYAARSGGLDRSYPWGEAEPTCDLAIINEDDNCGTYSTWPVCSKPDGNTEQGLCDMAGNAFEWVQDWYHDDYLGAPGDGSAWEDPAGSYRVMRGGGINSDEPYRTNSRTFHGPEFYYSGMGFRCAR